MWQVMRHSAGNGQNLRRGPWTHANLGAGASMQAPVSTEESPRLTPEGTF